MRTKTFLFLAFVIFVVSNVSGLETCKIDKIYTNVRMPLSSDSVAIDCYTPQTTPYYASWGWIDYGVDRTVYVHIENIGIENVTVQTSKNVDEHLTIVDIDAGAYEAASSGGTQGKLYFYTIEPGQRKTITYTVKVPERKHGEQKIQQNFMIENAQYAQTLMAGIYGYDCNSDALCREDEHCVSAECEKLSCTPNQRAENHVCVYVVTTTKATTKATTTKMATTRATTLKPNTQPTTEPTRPVYQPSPTPYTAPSKESWMEENQSIIVVGGMVLIVILLVLILLKSKK